MPYIWGIGLIWFGIQDSLYLILVWNMAFIVGYGLIEAVKPLISLLSEYAQYLNGARQFPPSAAYALELLMVNAGETDLKQEQTGPGLPHHGSRRQRRRLGLHPQPKLP